MKKILTILLIIISIFIFDQNVSAFTYKRGIVTSKYTIKTAPSSSASAVKNDTGGSASLSYPEPVEVLGESGNFYQIKFCKGGFFYTGYIDKSKINVYTYETDDAYENSLKNQGFPADYARKLAILHAMHPNWSFTPSYTGRTTGGMDFYTAVNGEASSVGRNAINGSNESLRSTEDGAYKNGTWIPVAGNGWYAASRQTIAFFMDPRNFLDEGEVFMFENLGFNPATQTKDIVNKVLAGTFMNNPFECGANAVSCATGTHYYADSFMTAGTDKKVSPVHLASRVKQEQGSNGSILSLGKGYNGKYVGYYNFFNVGASGKTDAEVITNGFEWAVKKSWNNQHKSIYDGSDLIANNYVKRGQSNLYYQKFNTIVPDYYGNQYMQNVKAAFSEGNSNYESYFKSFSKIEEWEKSTYDFLIPIYQNMPSYTTLDVSGNADTTLKSLVVEGCNLNPEFQSSATYYECFASKSTSEINIQAATTNANAKLENPGKVSITNDEQTVEVKVTAINGSTGIYTIVVKRIDTDGVSPEKILNSIGIKTNNNLISNIEMNSDVSNIISNIKNHYHFAQVTVKDASGKQITDGKVKTGQSVTINNAGLTSTYKIVLYGDPVGDGNIDILDLLMVQKHILRSKVLTGEYFTAADINHDGKVDILDLLLVQKHLLNKYQISQE